MKQLNKIIQETLQEETTFFSNYKPGIALKQLREGLKIPQKEIYQGTNIKQSFLSQIETGSKNPNQKVYAAYQKAFGFSTQELIYHIISDYQAHIQQQVEQTEYIINALELYTTQE